MKLITGLVFAVIFGGIIALAQGKPAPSLTAEESLLIQAVMALQKTASAECEALASVKQYTELLTKANAQFTKGGKTIDWRTGTLAPVPTKPEAK